MLEAVRPLVLFAWVGLVPACYGYVDWIYPGDGDHDLTFNYIDVVYFTWSSSIAEPWMNLWCAPSPSDPQSKVYVYHEQVPTNGSNPQSFPYSDYNQKGLCHMQVESFSGDDFANTPTFNITSNDSVEPKTWGISALGEAGGSPDPSNIQELSAIPSTLLITATSTPSSSSSSSLPSSSSLALSTTIPPSSLTSPTSALPTLPPPPPHSAASSPSNDETTLTPAAKAGISIGSIFSFLAIVVVLLLARLMWSRRQQQQRAKSQEEESHGGNAASGPQGPQHSSMYEKDHMAEIGQGSVSRYEVDGEGIPNELQGRPRAELSGETGALER